MSNDSTASTACDNCERKNAAVLVATYALLPLGTATALNDLRSGALKNNHLPELKAHTLTARVPSRGYVYVVYPNSTVDCYLLDGAGQPLYYPNVDVIDVPAAPPAKPKAQTCSSEAAHRRAQFISIANAGQHPHVWLAYSRAHWSAAVRKKMVAQALAAAKPGAGKRFFCLDLKTALSGQVPTGAHLITQALLQTSVADYASDAQRHAVNLVLPPAPDGDGPLNDRHDQAAKAASTLASIAQAKAPKCPPLLVLLTDPIGMALQANHDRNLKVAEVFAVGHKTTEAERDAMALFGMVENLHLSIDKAKGDWPRHEKHIDPVKWKEAKANIDKRKRAAEKVDSLSADYAALMSAPDCTRQWIDEFDPASVKASAKFEELFATCVAGSGATPVEREKLWAPWLTMAPDEPNNPLWRAATANQPGLMLFLALDKIDKTFDAKKISKDLFNEAKWSQHLTATINSAWQLGKNRRAYGAASASIAQTLAGSLLALGRSNTKPDKKLFYQTALRMATIHAGRADVVSLPRSVSGRAVQYGHWVQARWMGQPKVAAPLSIQPTTGVGNAVKRIKNVSSLADTNLKQDLQAMQGVLMLDIDKRDAAKVLAFTTWYTTKLKPGEAPDLQIKKMFDQLGLQPHDYTLPQNLKLNPLDDARFAKNVAKADIGFSTGTAFVQLWVLYINIKQVVEENSKDAKDRDGEKFIAGVEGIGTAALTIVAAGLEVKAVTDVMANAGVKTVLTKQLMVSAGVLGVLCGLADAALFWRQANTLQGNADTDASDMMKLASVFTAVSSGSIGYAAFAMAAGASGVGIPIAIAAGLAFAVVSLIAQFSALQKTDTDLEKWLDRGRFGKRERPDSKEGFASLADELMALYRICYTAQLAVSTIGAGGGVLRTYVELDVPHYGAGSAVQVEWIGTTVFNELGQKPVVLKRAHYTQGNVKDVGQIETTGSIKAILIEHISVDPKDGRLQLSAEIGVRLAPSELFVQRDPITSKPRAYIRMGSQSQDVTDVPYFRDVKVKVVYKPDSANLPDVVIELAA